MAIISLMRQFLLASSPQLAAISVGGSVAYPTLLLQQLKSNDSSIQLDIHTGSWIGSIYGLAGIAAVLTPMIMQWRGRKTALIVTLTSIALGWILSYTATNTAMILVSECFHGFGTNSLLPVSCLSMTEMLAPKYRTSAMQLFGLNQVVGIAISGIAGQFLSFRTISLIMLVPVCLAFGVALTWPESPPWLAFKGDFDKCTKAFVWLRGTDEISKKELAELITAQKENLNVCNYNSMTFKGFCKIVTSRDFYVPSLHIYLLLNLLYWSGGDVVLIYYMEIVSKTTQNEEVAFYFAIIFYCIIVTGLFVTNFTLKYFDNKTVLLTSTFGVILSSIGICIVTYLQSTGVVTKDSLLCAYFLMSFMSCNSLGLCSGVFFISAEIMPVRYRNVGGAFYIICNCGLYASTLKISPYMIYYIGISGTFMIFTCNAIICSLLVWKYVPETKGRTLQDIEDFYRFGKFIERTIDEDVVLDIMEKTKMKTYS